MESIIAEKTDRLTLGFAYLVRESEFVMQRPFCFQARQLVPIHLEIRSHIGDADDQI